MRYYKKAQAAMEFLMTYGWAILIVIVAIGVLFYSGVIGRAFFFPERCVISTGSGLFCEDFVAYPGAVILKIRNALPDSVEITNASVSQDDYSCNLTTSITIPAEGSRKVALTGGPTCFNLTEYGKKIRGDVLIKFKKKYLPRTTTADLLVKVTEATAYICKNANKTTVCGGLDLTFGLGYRSECCYRHKLCCPQP